MSSIDKKIVTVSVTGATGHIGYAILFRILSGNLFGKEIKVNLQIIDINDEKIRAALSGVAMEIEDSAFPVLNNLSIHTDPTSGFNGADVAFLIGARPRGPGMERKDLLLANGKIFVEQGKALNESASRDVKVLVVGNPANTNAYIAMKSAPDLKKRNFSAMMRLDHNRAVAQLSKKLMCSVDKISQICVWGNHSPTMVVDVNNALLNDSERVIDQLDPDWILENLMPNVAKRGAAIIKQRGLSSAASAASAAIDHMHDWVNGTQSWTTMGIPSYGEYGIPEDLVFGFPTTCHNGGDISVVNNLVLDKVMKEKIKLSVDELIQEKENVADLIS